jgi:hypothetical protein
LPEKSRYHYERAYNIFDEWRKKNRRGSFSEDVMLAFFQKLSQNMEPTSLWSTYSMLQSTINLKNDVYVSLFRLFIWS